LVTGKLVTGSTNQFFANELPITSNKFPSNQ
jgi:hypothetical protein